MIVCRGWRWRQWCLWCDRSPNLDAHSRSHWGQATVFSGLVFFFLRACHLLSSASRCWVSKLWVPLLDITGPLVTSVLAEVNDVSILEVLWQLPSLNSQKEGGMSVSKQPHTTTSFFNNFQAGCHLGQESSQSLQGHQLMVDVAWIELLPQSVEGLLSKSLVRAHIKDVLIREHAAYHQQSEQEALW